MANLLVNAWQGALLRMKIEKPSAPLKQCCRELLGDFLKRNLDYVLKKPTHFFYYQPGDRHAKIYYRT
jgi:hypothetical protein